MSGPEQQITSRPTAAVSDRDPSTGPFPPESPGGVEPADDETAVPFVTDVAAEPRRASLGRAATLITVGNLISRISGFVRVVAVAGALGIAFLGDSYQRANEVSNVLFELLIGGLLFSILVPSFVEHLTRATADATGRSGTDSARHLGSVLATRGAVFVGAVALVGMVGGTWIMRLLTLGTPEAVRAEQIRLGSFLLWFIMPQLIFYAAGAVASALLQADHRFLATSLAPLFNNVVVTATMVVFALQYQPSRGFDLTTGEKVLLGGGTLAGTVAMTIVPFVALWNAGLSIRPRWHARGLGLRTLVRRGAWAAGHVGLNEVLIGVTIILAGRVDGGVIAYQTAFMFFLLPHALIGYPIFTALFPRLSRKAATDDVDGFAADLTFGTRLILILLLPASGLLAVVAAPGLSIVRIGQLDSAGVRLVASVLAGFLAGLTAYSSFFLLTRASYALGDARSPTLVNLGATLLAIVAMFASTGFVHGTALLVGFGLIQAVALAGGSLLLYRIVRSRIARAVPVGGALWRAAVAAVPAVGVAFGVAFAIGWPDRARAVLAGGAAIVAGVLVDVILLKVCRTPELTLVGNQVTKKLRRAR